MNTDEITPRLVAIEARLSDLGYVKPSAQFSVRYFGESFTCWFTYHSSESANQSSEFFHGKTAEAPIELAENFVATLPPVSELRKADFLKALGRVIDQGREAAIEMDFLNPLTDTMKRLSENIITHVKETAE